MLSWHHVGHSLLHLMLTLLHHYLVLHHLLVVQLLHLLLVLEEVLRPLLHLVLLHKRMVLHLLLLKHVWLVVTSLFIVCRRQQLIPYDWFWGRRRELRRPLKGKCIGGTGVKLELAPMLLRLTQEGARLR